MKITEKDIEKLLENKILAIKDNKNYSFYIKLTKNILTISYGLFSNPLEYRSIYFNGVYSLDYINKLVLNSKQNFIDEVDTPHMRYHYA